MRSFAEMERELDIVPPPGTRREAARWMLGLAEEALEAWIAARGDTPEGGEREGFRLLALHHQGARGVPSFNACRETCREIAFHYNLLAAEDAAASVTTMASLVRHLVLFVGGKLQVEGLGDFCCASRPVRRQDAMIAEGRSPGHEEDRHA